MDPKIEEMQVTITNEGQAALDTNGPNGGAVKIHGIDDTTGITHALDARARSAGLKLIPIQVMTGAYAGVMYVVDFDDSNRQ